MPYIKVNTDKIRTYATELEARRSSILNISSSFEYAFNCLDTAAKLSIPNNCRGSSISKSIYENLNSLSRMRDYLYAAAHVYDNGGSIPQNTKDTDPHILRALGLTVDIQNTGVGIAKFIVDMIGVKNLNVVFDGKYFRTSGYTDYTYANKYLPDNWLDHGLKSASKGMQTAGKVLDYVGYGLTAAEGVVDLTGRLHNVWTDENKDCETKVCDTIAHTACVAAGTALKIGASMVVGKAVGATVGAACCVIPVVGPLIGVVVGSVTSYVAGKAVSAIADLITSPTVVGAVSSGVKAVCTKATEIGNKIGKEASKQIGKVISAGQKVVSKVADTAKKVANTVKSVANVAKKLLKGW